MNLDKFLKHMGSGFPVRGGSDVHLFMHKLAQDAMKITCELNGSYHEPEEIRALFSALIGKPLNETFMVFPPFYTDCGKNMALHHNVWVQILEKIE